MVKEQITLTLEPEYVKYLQDMAKALFEGNVSMAARKTIAEHSKKINYTSRDDP